MKILFAIQGTGNGHLSRAKDIIPELSKYGEVDILLSGYQVDVQLPYPIKYRKKGLCFIFGKHGGINMKQTFRRLSLFRFIKDVISLPVDQYDAVINDFEPVTAWACKLRRLPCISLSHQSAVLHPLAPKPKSKGWLGRWVLKYYAPADDQYGFHFKRYDNHIFLPVIRKEVQELEPTQGKHYTVYLPAYDDITLIRFLSRFKHVQWEVFSKHSKDAFRFENIKFIPIENEAYLQSIASCTGALLGAGFEGPSEALYLGKKLMVVPMKGQYEQQCNAAAIKELGVPVVPALSFKVYDQVKEWIDADWNVTVSFPKETAAIAVQRMMEDFIHKKAQTLKPVPGFG